MPTEQCQSSVEWLVDLRSNDETLKVAEGILTNISQDTFECFDGIRRKLCRFPNYRQISDFKKTAEAREVPYKIYFRKDPHGVIRAL